MHPLLSHFALLYPGVNRAAVVSQWSMNYMSIALPAALACALTRDCAIDFWGEEVVLFHDDGQPLALGLGARLPAISAEERSAYWSRVTHEHLAPLFTTLAAAGGLAPKILWGNMVAIWDGAFARMDADLSRDGFAEAHQWLEQATVNEGRLKLRSLQRIVESPAPHICPSLPLRRHCCLHYQLHEPVEGTPPVLCESCPKLHRLPVAEQVSYLNYIYQDS
ncbi:siderophore-iron reductase FhuF [Pseudomonas sp. PB120]|nr:siderophore-iron reductase FhuF [Pseudomonas sp. PB120]MVV51778.1 siderophore-iron reductase FhuF [Pseudomonas sp. PB120]